MDQMYLNNPPNFQLLFEGSPGLYLVLNVQFNIVAASDSYLKATMVERTDILGKYIFDVFPDNPNDVDATGVQHLKASLNRVLDNKTADFMTIQKYDIKNQLGIFEERFWGPVNFPVFNKNDQVEYIIHRVEDVTELVKLKNEKFILHKATIELQEEREHIEKARQAKRMEAMGQLAGGVAHDFNNILATIILLCEDTIRNSKDSDPAQKNLKQILKSSEKAKTLTRQLLAFSRKQVIQPKVVNLNHIISDLKDLLKKLLDERFELITDLDDNLKNVFIDASQVEQILINLVVNSRDAMTKGGRMTIATTTLTLKQSITNGYLHVDAGEYVLITVKDEGVGMDAETQARIFEPFFSTKEFGFGTGLGLSSVYGIVKQNKGYVWVTSEAQKGSIFKIYLPVIEQSLEIIHSGSDNIDFKINANESQTVLVVEDEVDLREAIRDILSSVGYKIIEAIDGEEALKMILDQQVKPSLIISDVMMPKLTGPSLAIKLKEAGMKNKFLFLSGYVDDFRDVNKEIIEEHSFLEKPFELNTLIDKVKKLTFNNN